MPELTLVDILLFVVFLAVLIMPFTIKLVEENLEAFLFVMGALAVTVSSNWAWGLIEEAFSEPILKGIVPAVLGAGLVFHYGATKIQRLVGGILKAVPFRDVLFAIVVVLGLLSSLITAIIAALLLVEIIHLLPLPRGDKNNLVIIACFSIGLGAALTPLGEPLSTIAVSKLSGAPYHANFWYLLDQVGVLIILGVLGCGLLAAIYVGKARSKWVGYVEAEVESGKVRDVLVRSVKVYAFVSALFLLGGGMEVIIDKYFTQLPATILFWVNMLSAILDNATLTAAEIAPSMTQGQINAALMGLLISGGMLIPGNIPNIISAGKLGITSSEWAKLGVPLGLIINAIYFVAIFFLGFTPRLGL